MYTGAGIIKIYAGSTGRPFAEKMCAYLGTQLGDAETIKFSEGNIFVRINESIRDKDVYLVQPIGRQPNDEFVEILFWIDAFKRASANSVTVIVPYFSYAKGDKKDEPRVSIRARVCADCIESAGADRFITMDLHAPQVQGFFKIPVDHLYAKSLLCEYIRRQGLVDDNLVVVSPDAGSAKRAREYATELGCPVAIGDKMRSGHDENAKVLEIIGEVAGKNCLVIDDFSISGGTLVDVSRGLKEKGANHVLRRCRTTCSPPRGFRRSRRARWSSSFRPIRWNARTPVCPLRSASSLPLRCLHRRSRTDNIVHDRTSMSSLFEQRVNKRMMDMSFMDQPTLLKD